MAISLGLWVIPRANAPVAEARRAFCVNTTSFGVPDEPDVYVMVAMVSGVGGLSGDGSNSLSVSNSHT